MVAPMTPEASRLYTYLQNPESHTFDNDLPFLLDEFTSSITGTPCFHNPLMVVANVHRSLQLIQPLLALLSYNEDVPYECITRALSALLTPLPFEELRAMDLYPVMAEGLRSPIPEIQILALKQAKKMTDVDDDMVISLFDCLGADDADVGEKTVEVLTTVLSPKGANVSSSNMNPFKRYFYALRNLLQHPFKSHDF